MAINFYCRGCFMAAVGAAVGAALGSGRRGGVFCSSGWVNLLDVPKMV